MDDGFVWRDVHVDSDERQGGSEQTYAHDSVSENNSANVVKKLEDSKPKIKITIDTTLNPNDSDEDEKDLFSNCFNQLAKVEIKPENDNENNKNIDENDDENDDESDDENYDGHSQDPDTPMKKTTDYEMVVCPECDKTFTSKHHLQIHHYAVHLIQVTYCEFCSKEFKNRYLCKRHVKHVHSDTEGVQCDQCDKVFKIKRLLYNHKIAVHAESDDMYCHVCGGKFKNYYSLKRHVRKCEIKPRKTPKNFVPGNKIGQPGFDDGVYDEECDRTYLTKKTYREHMTKCSHSGETELCRICEAVLKTKATLKMHLKMKHGIEVKELLKGLAGTGYAKRGRSLDSSEIETCVTCGKEYGKNYYMSTHRDKCAAGIITRGKPTRTKVDTQVVNCATCGQEYSQSYYHRTHRDRCAAGDISTRPPMNPEAIASITSETLFLYATPKPVKNNEEVIKKREETLKKWREIEEEQRKDAELHPEKYPTPRPRKRKTSSSPVKAESEKVVSEQFVAPAQWNSSRVEEDEEPFVPEEEDIKEDPAYPDVKLEVESDSEEGSSDDSGSDEETRTSDQDDYVGSSEGQILKEDIKDENKASIKPMKVDDASESEEKPLLETKVKKKRMRGIPGIRKVPRTFELGYRIEEPGFEEAVYCEETDRTYLTKENYEKRRKPGTPGTRRHRRKEDGEQSICNICSIPCVSLRALSEHFKNFHPEKCIACPECGLAMMTLRGLRKHMKTKHTLTTDETVEKLKMVKKYIKENGLQSFAESGEYNCEVCESEGKPPKRYKEKSQLNSHTKNWHIKGTHLCVVCGESFELRGQLYNHNEKEHRSNPSLQPKSCPHCGLEVLRLERHIADVHEKVECVCPQCAKIFTSMRNMLDHVRNMHDDEGQQFVCHLCKKECISKLSLKQHLRRQHRDMATKEEDYSPCPECGKTFPCKRFLTDHIKNVHEVDLVRCELCRGKYRNKNALMKHMKNMHSGPQESIKVGKGSYRKGQSLSPSLDALQPKNEEDELVPQIELQQQHPGFGFPPHFERHLLPVPGQEYSRDPFNHSYPSVLPFLPPNHGNQ